MQNTADMNSQIVEEKYNKLIEKFIAENEHAENNPGAENRCRIGLRKLKLAKDFSEIDTDLLNVSASKSYSSDFFSGILFLESKRLTFKEEALKCLTSAQSL